MKNINLYFWILLILLILILGFLLYKIKYYNAYIGINNEPCIFCRTIKGEHMHFLNQSLVKNFPNWANNGVECNFCKEYPGIIHIHNK
jgi:hypothetical protein